MDRAGKLFLTSAIGAILVGALYILEYFQIRAFIQSVSVELVGAAVVGLTTWAMTSTSKSLADARQLRLLHFNLWQSVSRGPKFIDSTLLHSFAERIRETSTRYQPSGKKWKAVDNYASSVEVFEAYFRSEAPPSLAHQDTKMNGGR